MNGCGNNRINIHLEGAVGSGFERIKSEFIIDAMAFTAGGIRSAKN